MKRVSLGPLPIKVSRIGFGCAPVLGRVGKGDSLYAMGQAFDRGVTHFDVARSYGYGEAEGVLGNFVSDKRDKVTITTKFGLVPARSSKIVNFAKPVVRRLIQTIPALASKARRHSLKFSPTRSYDVPGARESVEKSLRSLKTDYLDFILIHDCENATEIGDELLLFLEKLKVEGTVAAWGLASTYDSAGAISALLPRKPDIIQFGRLFGNEMNSWDQELGETPRFLHSPFGGRNMSEVWCRLWKDKRLQHWAKTNDIEIENKSSLYRPLLESALYEAPHQILIASMFQEAHIDENTQASSNPKFESAQLKSFIAVLREILGDVHPKFVE